MNCQTLLSKVPRDRRNPKAEKMRILALLTVFKHREDDRVKREVTHVQSLREKNKYCIKREAMDGKYRVKDACKKRFITGKFIDLINSKTIMNQVHESQLI